LKETQKLAEKMKQIMSMQKSGTSQNDKKDLATMFRNYALEIYGTSLLESNEDITIATIFDHIFEHKINQLNLE